MLLILSQASALQNAIMYIPPSFSSKLVSMKYVIPACLHYILLFRTWVCRTFNPTRAFFKYQHIFILLHPQCSSILSPDPVCHFCSFQYALVWQVLFKYLLYHLLCCLGKALSPHMSLFSLQLSCREPHSSHVQWTELDEIIFSCISRILIQ